MLPGSQGPGCSMLAALPATPRSIVSAVPEQVSPARNAVPEPVSPARNAVRNPVCPHVTAFSAVLLRQEQSGEANLVGFKTILFSKTICCAPTRI